VRLGSQAGGGREKERERERERERETEHSLHKDLEDDQQIIQTLR